MSQRLRAEAPDLAAALAGWEWRHEDDSHEDDDVVKVSARGAWFFIRVKDARAATGGTARRYARVAESVMDLGHRGNITTRVRRQLRGRR